MTTIILSILVITYLITRGVIEGWVWYTRDNNNNDPEELITFNTYHHWRLVESFSIFIIACFVFPSITTALGSWIIGLTIYERIMVLVSHNDFWLKKPPFVLGKTRFNNKISINHPKPIIEFFIGISIGIILIII